MRYKVTVSGKALLLTEPQLALLMTAVQDAEQEGEFHVGAGKGSQGYQKSYIPTLEVKQPHEWLTANIVADDYVETTRLVASLNKEQP